LLTVELGAHFLREPPSSLFLRGEKKTPGPWR